MSDGLGRALFGMRVAALTRLLEKEGVRVPVGAVEEAVGSMSDRAAVQVLLDKFAARPASQAKGAQAHGLGPKPNRPIGVFRKLLGWFSRM